MDKFIARHGDVLVFKIEELPKNLKEKKNNVLAYGEVTGHSHRVVGKDKRVMPNLVFFEGEDGNTYIKAPEKFYLDHEEHGLLGGIEPGNYVIKIKREKDHLNDLIRQVQD